MILYGSGEPIAALRKVGKLRAERPLQGRQMGGPARQGVGRAKSPSARATWGPKTSCARSRTSATPGPLTIEREIAQEPERQKAEIGQAVRLLNELKAKIGMRVRLVIRAGSEIL